MMKLLPALLSLGGLSSSVLAAPLYETSFEKEKKGGFQTAADNSQVEWIPDSASISAKFAKTGKQSLHLRGGKDSVTRMVLKGDVQNAKGISFWAERWTVRGPFEFKVEANVDGKWKTIAKLDQVIQVGARFRSQITLAFPDGKKVSEVKFTLNTPTNTGVLVDDLSFLAQKPKEVTKVPKYIAEPTEPLELLSKATVFTAGEDDTHTYRIPSIITAKNGDLIAACDARRNNSGDLIHKNSRDIDIVIKRSSDGGKTWGPMEIVADYPDGTGGTDPSMVLDRDTGEIFMFYSYMGKVPSKEFFFRVQSSKDNGKTWSEPRDITEDISKPEWKNSFKFISSGRASQKEDGTLIHNYVVIGKGVKIFASPDHGKTWELRDAEIKPADESRVLELTDGRLMVNSRVGGGFRWVHLSKDNGKTWESKKETQLIDPRCNGAILRYTSKKDGYAKDRLLFCNAGSKQGRKNLTVRISYDEGETWSEGKVVDPGPSAYSELTILEDGTIGVLYEPGYKSIGYARFSLEALTDGEDKLTKPYVIK